MYLNYLKIFYYKQDDQIVIRDIFFNRGLNIVSDKTSKNKNESGNNLGKSTFMEIIDICLGAKSINKIYTDKKTKSVNNKVKSFLEDSKVIAELSFSISNNEYIVNRALYKDAQDDFIINKISYKSLNKYNEKLNKIIFNNEYNKPTIREVLPKFIRINEDAVKGTLDIFMDKTADAVKYYTLVFLFGWSNLDLLSKLSEIKKELNTIKNTQILFNKRFQSKEEIEVLLKTTDKDILEYKNQLEELGLVSSILNAIEKEDDNKIDISSLREERLNLEFAITKHRSSLKVLEENISNISERDLKYFYEDVKLELSNIRKTFQELLIFHNKAIDNEKKFIQSNLYNLENKLLVINDEINKYVKKKVEVEAIHKISEIQFVLEQLNIKKGRLLDEKEKLYKLQNESIEVEKKYTQLENEISLSTNKLKENLNIFNDIFRRNQLLLESKGLVQSYLIVAYNEKIGIEIIDNDGKKGLGFKSQDSLVFNLSYSEYIRAIGLNYPNFFIMDCSELIDINKKGIIFSELVEKTKTQLFIPSLTSSLPDEIKQEISKYTILELSENDKLFRI